MNILSTCFSLVSFSVIAELLEKRTSVVDKLQEFETTIDPILSVLTHPEVTKHFEESGK